MIGNNNLMLNGATVAAAIQFWLDAQFKIGCSPEVQSVCWTGSVFSVSIKPRDKKETE
jgi:hypothetical protein